MRGLETFTSVALLYACRRLSIVSPALLHGVAFSPNHSGVSSSIMVYITDRLTVAIHQLLKANETHMYTYT